MSNGRFERTGAVWLGGRPACCTRPSVYEHIVQTQFTLDVQLLQQEISNVRKHPFQRKVDVHTRDLATAQQQFASIYPSLI